METLGVGYDMTESTDRMIDDLHGELGLGVTADVVASDWMLDSYLSRDSRDQHQLSV